MHFTSVLSILAVTYTVASASPLSLEARDGASPDPSTLNAGNHYGAPLPPWTSGAHPGWYYGNDPKDHGNLAHLSNNICKYKNFRCPPPTPDGYVQTFSNLSGATQAGDYLTFGLVDSVADCKAMCNSVAGCSFVNTYHDVNGKNGSPLLTCSLFKNCHTAADAINKGGQTQPNGSVNFIRNSDGWCKK